MEKSGRQPASKRPKKNLAASKSPNELHAAMADCAMPQPRTRHGMRMRWGTLTIRTEENGCHASWAMGAMEPTREYWLPVRLVSSWRPKRAP